jgi:septal ring factor EnvC (AmiA/AmiB activator)
MAETNPELFVTLGRIEESVRYLKESFDRVEKKVDAQDVRIQEVELDIKELKTQRDSKSNRLALLIALAAVAVSIVSIFIQ